MKNYLNIWATNGDVEVFPFEGDLATSLKQAADAYLQDEAPDFCLYLYTIEMDLDAGTCGKINIIPTVIARIEQDVSSRMSEDHLERLRANSAGIDLILNHLVTRVSE